MKNFGEMCMKSTTIRRSNLSKEKMAVLEALKKYRADDSEFAPNVYVRPGQLEHEKNDELDLLWRNFKTQDISLVDNKPKLYILTGIIAGILLVSTVSMTLLFSSKADKAQPNIASGSGFSLVPASSEKDIKNNETYVVQSGDTIEKILIRFYGQYSKTKEMSLLQANNMTNPNKLSIGQQLIIPMN